MISIFQADSLIKEVKGLWELEINECNKERVRKCQGWSNKMALVSINCCVWEVKGWEATTDSLLYTSMITSTPIKYLCWYLPSVSMAINANCRNEIFFLLIKCPYHLSHLSLHRQRTTMILKQISLLNHTHYNSMIDS